MSGKSPTGRSVLAATRVSARSGDSFIRAVERGGLTDLLLQLKYLIRCVPDGRPVSPFQPKLPSMSACPHRYLLRLPPRSIGRTFAKYLEMAFQISTFAVNIHTKRDPISEVLRQRHCTRFLRTRLLASNPPGLQFNPLKADIPV